jgi:hypothetical protein
LFKLEVPPCIDSNLLTLITGYVIKELQDLAEENKARTLIYNLCAYNNFDNDRFLGLVLAAAEYAALQLSSDENPEDTIRRVVTITTSVATASLLNEYPELLAVLSIIHRREFRKYLEMGVNIKKEVQANMYPTNQNFYQHNLQPQTFVLAYDQNNQPVLDSADMAHLFTDEYGSELYRPEELGYQPSYPCGRLPPQHHQPQQAQRRFNPAPPQHSGGTPVVNGRYGGGGGNAVEVNRGALNNPTRHQMQGRQRGTTSEVGSANATYRDYQQPEQVQVNTGQSRRVGTGTVNKAPVEQKSNGVVIEPSYETKLEKTRTENQPYPLAYDPSKQEMFSVKDNNVVVHDIKQRTVENLDYLEHELNPKLRSKYLREAAEAQARLKKTAEPVAALHNTAALIEIVDAGASTISELKENEYLSTNKVVYVDGEDGVIECASLAEGVSICEQKLRTNKINPRSAFSFQANVLEKVIISKVDHDLILEIRGNEFDRSFASVAAALNNYQTLAERPSRLWYIINDKLTKLVNDSIKYGLGISAIDIDSFATDAPEVIPYLASKYNGKIADIIGDLSDEIISKVFDSIKVEDVDGILVATITDSITTVSLPFTAMELRVNFDNSNYGLIMPAKLPQLYQVLTRLLDGLNPTDRAVLVTSDNITLDVRRGLIVHGSILLSV